MVSACNYDYSVRLIWQVFVMARKVKVFGAGLDHYWLFGHMTRVHHWTRPVSDNKDFDPVITVDMQINKHSL